jgi:hypothetical protein
LAQSSGKQVGLKYTPPRRVSIPSPRLIQRAAVDCDTSYAREQTRAEAHLVVSVLATRSSKVRYISTRSYSSTCIGPAPMAGEGCVRGPCRGSCSWSVQTCCPEMKWKPAEPNAAGATSRGYSIEPYLGGRSALAAGVGEG